VVAVLVAFLIAGHMAFMLWGTGAQTARAQAEMRAQLAHEAPAVVDSGGRVEMPSRFALGAPLGILRIPRIHVDMVFVEGTGEGELEKGPGHYAGTAYPWDDTGTAPRTPSRSGRSISFARATRSCCRPRRGRSGTWW
jgi:sortase (surface protein transpeptidase)